MKTLKFIADKNMITAFSGLFCIFLGLGCLIGWYTHTIELIQIRPGLTPMVYNTALGFFIFGMGLLFLLSPYKKLAIFCGVVIAGIGGLTLIEYIFNIQLGIDELFLESYVTTNTVSPGRMSPNSAISFMVCGISLMLLSLREPSRKIYYMVLFLGIVLFCLSSIAFLGYSTNIPGTYQWYKLTPMALHTSIGFLIACTGIAAFVYNKQISGKINLSKAMPVFAFLCVMSFTCLLWRAAYQESLLNVQHLTLLETEKIKESIESKVEESILDLLGLKTQGVQGVSLSEKEWINSTEFYKKNHPWYDAILWFDSKLQAMFTATFNKDITSLTQNEKLKRDLFEKAIINRGISISPILDFTPQSKGVLITVPLYNEALLEGFIVGFINTDYLFHNILENGSESGFNVIFYQGNKQLYDTPNSDKTSYQGMSSHSDIKLYDLDWQITVHPTKAFLREKTFTFLSYLILAIGFCIGGLLAAVIRSRLILKDQERILEKTQALLKEQLFESTRLSRELSLMKEMTDSLQACSTLAKTAGVISKYCMLLMPSTSGRLYLIDDTQKKLEPFARWGNIPVNDVVFSIKKCMALQKEVSWYKSGDTIDQLCEHTQDEETQIGKGTYLCIPLINHDKILGLLQISYPNETTDFSPTHPSLEETLAKQLTLTLANIMLRDLLKNQATRDPLTNLFNRRYLDESLPRELYQAKRYKRPLSLIMVDVDHFKTVNDTYGHKGGDMVLKQIASILQEKSRKGDIACRFGGEEFLLVLQEASLDDALSRAEQLRKEISALHFTWNNEDMGPITASFGVSSFPENGDLAEDLIANADDALYQAKETGRNRVASFKTNSNQILQKKS